MRKLGKSLCLFCKKWLHIEHLILTGKLLSTSLCLLFLCFCDLARFSDVLLRSCVCISMEYLHWISHSLFQNDVFCRISSQKSKRSLHNASSGKVMIFIHVTV